MTSLKEIQEAMVGIWGSRKGFEDYAKSGQIPGLGNEFESQLDPNRVKLYFEDVSTRRAQVTRNCYSLTLRVIGKNKTGLVEKYWEKYKSSSSNPIFELANFPKFLRDECEELKDFPYLADLAEYEWMRRELQLDSSILECGSFIDLKSSSKRQLHKPVANATIKLRRFGYPVHQIASRTAAGRWRKHRYEAGDFYLAVYQDPKDRTETRIQGLGQLAYKLLEVMISGRSSYEELIQYAVEELPDDKLSRTRNSVIEMLRQFNNCGILLGSIPLNTEATTDD
ncbi:MAG: hypothetical protein K2X27_21630 [Candidatus Obscuribacterales bacterium]|nr:hypothetical protein [Candidatus Obscuribacterales bacterium]